jgi:hypothetical protein
VHHLSGCFPMSRSLSPSAVESRCSLATSKSQHQILCCHNFLERRALHTVLSQGTPRQHSRVPAGD